MARLSCGASNSVFGTCNWPSGHGGPHRNGQMIWGSVDDLSERPSCDRSHFDAWPGPTLIYITEGTEPTVMYLDRGLDHPPGRRDLPTRERVILIALLEAVLAHATASDTA